MYACMYLWRLSNHYVTNSFTSSMHCLVKLNLSHITFITFISFKFLFFVSILHSSQNTIESLLVGSEWVLKHYHEFIIIKITFKQIEWPQTRVKGSVRYSKQLKQDKVVSIESKLFFIFYIASIIPFFTTASLSTFFKFSANSVPITWLFDFSWSNSSLTDFSYFLSISISLS
jgi:hypothetical protein